MEIRGVHVKVGEFELKGVDLNVDEGQYFILLGPTGVGKTILLETLAGIHRVARGQIFIDSQDVTHMPPEERRISYVPQDYALFPNMNVRENISFGLKMKKMAKSQIDEEVGNYAMRLGIAHLLDRPPQQLSGGEKQRGTPRGPLLWMMHRRRCFFNIGTSHEIQARRHRPLHPYLSDRPAFWCFIGLAMEVAPGEAHNGARP